MTNAVLKIDTSEYFNKSQYKGDLEVYADGRFSNYLIRWSQGGKLPDALTGSYTDTASAKNAITGWLMGMSRGAEDRARKANAKVKPKVKEQVDA